MTTAPSGAVPPPREGRPDGEHRRGSWARATAERTVRLLAERHRIEVDPGGLAEHLRERVEQVAVVMAVTPREARRYFEPERLADLLAEQLADEPEKHGPAAITPLPVEPTLAAARTNDDRVGSAPVDLADLGYAVAWCGLVAARNGDTELAAAAALQSARVSCLIADLLRSGPDPTAERPGGAQIAIELVAPFRDDLVALMDRVAARIRSGRFRDLPGSHDPAAALRDLEAAREALGAPGGGAGAPGTAAGEPPRADAPQPT
ncbi:MAG: hypothetical protein R2737_10530 [Candidatus Nanopelagicales bacterium]